jgi:hypothetical protein
MINRVDIKLKDIVFKNLSDRTLNDLVLYFDVKVQMLTNTAETIEETVELSFEFNTSIVRKIINRLAD